MEYTDVVIRFRLLAIKSLFLWVRGSVDLVAGGASRPIRSGIGRRRRVDADAAAACRWFDSYDDDNDDDELVDDSEVISLATVFWRDEVAAALGADDVSTAVEQLVCVVADLGLAPGLLVPGWRWPTGAMRSSAGALSTMLRLSMLLVGRLASSF